MYWAQKEDNKIIPFPGGVAFCPMCGEKVIAKCGKIYKWHWSHLNNKDCDNWHEPESDWHLLWKNTFGKNRSEITISKGEIKHRADVLTVSEVVIEIQNSPISAATIIQREEFYGERMVWLINCESFKENCEFLFTYINPYSMLDDSKIKQNAIRNKVKAKVPTINWHRPKKSWVFAIRNIFVDFGEDLLFWAKEGMGTNQVTGDYIKKESFIKKYGGDFQYYLENKIS